MPKNIVSLYVLWGHRSTVHRPEMLQFLHGSTCYFYWSGLYRSYVLRHIRLGSLGVLCSPLSLMFVRYCDAGISGGNFQSNNTCLAAQ